MSLRSLKPRPDWSPLGVTKSLSHAQMVSFRGWIQNFRRASPSVPYGSPLPRILSQIVNLNLASTFGIACPTKFKHWKTTQKINLNYFCNFAWSELEIKLSDYTGSQCSMNTLSFSFANQNLSKSSYWIFNTYQLCFLGVWQLGYKKSRVIKVLLSLFLFALSFFAC